jgi:diguanylate cyclase (GGDEF)-like protein
VLKTRQKLYLSAGALAVTLLLLAAFSIYFRDINTAEALEKQSLIHQHLTLVNRTQVQFKKQVQEWKNILLRGHQENDYQYYLSEFLRQDAKVKKTSRTLLNSLSPQHPSFSLTKDFIEMHSLLSQQYQEALKALYASEHHDFVATDTIMRGADRAPMLMLEENENLLSKKVKEAKLLVAQEANRSQWVILGVGLLFIFIVGFSFMRLARKWLVEVTFDPTTGLHNRRELLKDLQQVIVQKEDVFLLLVDIDQFKLFNEVCGHEGADHYLVQIANLLQEKLPFHEHYHIYRTNADEFVIWYPSRNEQKAVALADKVRKLIACYIFYWQGNPFSTTCTIAVINVDRQYVNVKNVLSHAEIALQEAKEKGRDTTLNYNCLHEGIARRQKQMRSVHQIMAAIKDDRFMLHKQYVKSLAKGGGDSSYYEILIRLRGHDGTIVFPGDFLPAAEKYHVADQVDRWVIKTLCAHLEKNPTDTDRYAINLSGATLSDKSFTDFITSVFNACTFDVSRLSFEITETDAIKQFQVAQTIVHNLKKYGCRVALDDFGTGVSSFQYLLALQVDSIKIDGVFIKDILHSEVNKAIIRSVVDIAKTLSITTVAEFVEDKTIEEQVSLFGVDYGQGYGIHKPEPLV